MWVAECECFRAKASAPRRIPSIPSPSMMKIDPADLRKIDRKLTDIDSINVIKCSRYATPAAEKIFI